MKEKDKETLLNLYNQTWQLYIHEDQLSETRNSKFLSLVTAIFGVIGTILSLIIPLVDGIKDKGNTELFYIVVISVLILVLVILFFILRNWKRVNLAGKNYKNAYEEQAKIIEEELLDSMLANNEALIVSNRREIFNKLNNDTKEGGKNIRKKAKGGFSSTEELILVFMIIDISAILGLISLLVYYILY